MTFSPRMMFPARVLACFLLLAAAWPVAATAQEYRLGAMDRVTVRVVEWQSAEAAVRDWSSISGEYVVGPAGRISMPFVGELEAAGKTTAEIAAEIGDALQQHLGLLDKPEASVELAEFRPIFISGDVQTPGRYPYDPNLTVLKAVSIAGGIRRVADSSMRIERDFINASGDHDVLAADRKRLLARQARLQAEATGADTIDFPDDLESTPEGQQLIEDETRFMQSRSDRLERQLAEIENLKALLEREIAALEQKITTQQRQIELATEELQGIGNLADRGLVVNERVLSLERSVADLEGRVLDMETASLRARQDIAEATQDATTLQADYESEVAQELQQAEADLEEAELKIATQSNLMMEALARAPEVAASAPGTEPQISYTIVRPSGEEGQPAEMAAEEHTPVLPGDVVKVDIEAPVSQ